MWDRNASQRLNIGNCSAAARTCRFVTGTSAVIDRISLVLACICARCSKRWPTSVVARPTAAECAARTLRNSRRVRLRSLPAAGGRVWLTRPRRPAVVKLRAGAHHLVLGVSWSEKRSQVCSLQMNIPFRSAPRCRRQCPQRPATSAGCSAARFGTRVYRHHSADAGRRGKSSGQSEWTPLLQALVAVSMRATVTRRPRAPSVATCPIAHPEGASRSVAHRTAARRSADREGSLAALPARSGHRRRRAPFRQRLQA